MSWHDGNRRMHDTLDQFLRRSVWAIIMVVLIAYPFAVTAQQKTAGADASTSSGQTSTRKSDLTARQQAMLQEFVQKHHPELNDLLTYLQQNRPQAYKQAVRDLYRSIARIESLRERDAERYQLELRLWQLRSRSELLAAKLTMLDDQQREEELRQLMSQLLDVRVQILQHEQARIHERLAKLNEQINQLQENRQAFIEKELESLLRATRAAAKSAKRAASSAGKRGTGATGSTKVRVSPTTAPSHQ